MKNARFVLFPLPLFFPLLATANFKEEADKDKILLTRLYY